MHHYGAPLGVVLLRCAALAVVWIVVRRYLPRVLAWLERRFRGGR
jgi:hypothetical protein